MGEVQQVFGGEQGRGQLEPSQHQPQPRPEEDGASRPEQGPKLVGEGAAEPHRAAEGGQHQAPGQGDQGQGGGEVLHLPEAEQLGLGPCPEELGDLPLFEEGLGHRLLGEQGKAAPSERLRGQGQVLRHQQ